MHKDYASKPRLKHYREIRLETRALYETEALPRDPVRDPRAKLYETEALPRDSVRDPGSVPEINPFNAVRLLTEIS